MVKKQQHGGIIMCKKFSIIAMIVIFSCMCIVPTFATESYELNVGTKQLPSTATLSINLNDMPDKSYASSNDSLEISVTLKKNPEFQEGYVDAKSTGVVTINGKKNAFVAEGTLSLYENNIALGCLSGYINNSSNPSDCIALSMHYDIKEGTMYIPTSLGAFTEDGGEPLFFVFGENVSTRITDTVKTKLQTEKKQVENDKADMIKQLEEQMEIIKQPDVSINGAYPGNDYISKLANSASGSNGGYLGLYAPNAVYPTNSGVGDVGIVTKVDGTKLISYMKSQGYPVQANSNGCSGPISFSIKFNTPSSGLVYLTSAWEPKNSSTSIKLPVPTSSNPATWGSITITTASSSVTHTSGNSVENKLAWNFSRLAGFTSQIYSTSSSGGMGAKAEFKHGAMPNAKTGTITANANYNVSVVRSDNYTYVYSVVNLTTSKTVNIG